jgi:hypothetical protein
LSAGLENVQLQHLLGVPFKG